MNKVGLSLVLLLTTGACPTATPTKKPSPTPVLTGLSKVCAKVSKVVNGELLVKSEASTHINPNDCRTTGYTLVCGSKCPSSINAHGITALYFSDGTRAAQLGYYGTFAQNGKPRAYGCSNGAPQHYAAKIAVEAKEKGRNGKLYLRMASDKTGPNTLCKEVNAEGRTGDV